MLTIKDIQQEDVVTAHKDATIYDIAKLIYDRNISCVVIIEKLKEVDVAAEKPTFFERIFGKRKKSPIQIKNPKKPLGIISLRDFVSKVVSKGIDPEVGHAADIMTTKLITASENDTLVHAVNLMKQHNCRRIPILERGLLQGMITQADILIGCMRHLEELDHELNNISVDMDEYRKLIAKSSELYEFEDIDVTPDDTVSKIMTQAVFSLDANVSVLDAAKQMSEQVKSSVIITNKGSPVGIVSELDILSKIIMTRLSPEKTLLSKIMTTPIHSISSDMKISEVVRLMKVRGFKRFPVVEDNIVLGMVTESDLRHALSAVIKRKQKELIDRWSHILEPGLK